ncbi:MAG: 50S ribosomal protein L4 [Candidatus Methanomethylicus sp.]|nr:50S ribosomal protein L4 [Candidatus Methanomethylicus sp.]
MPKKSTVETARIVNVHSLDGSIKGETPLPEVFSTEIRRDLVRRAVLSGQSARIQPRTNDYYAGKKTSAMSLGVGLDLARVPRVKGDHNPASGQGAFVPNVVGGRAAFPTQLEKKWRERINDKERRLAMKSAIAATGNLKLVQERGHLVGDNAVPFVVSDDLKSVNKASEFREFLKSAMLIQDIIRAKEGIKERSGRGKTRGRRWVKPKSILLVADEISPAVRLAARNFSGLDFAEVSSLNVERLAPGGHPGRLTIWTESAFKKLDELYA